MSIASFIQNGPDKIQMHDTNTKAQVCKTEMIIQNTFVLRLFFDK